MMRLSDPQETETTLALAGKPDLTRWADRGLRLAGYRGERSLLILGITGETRRARQTLRHATHICHRHGGLLPIGMIGRMWQKSRFLTPYLRNTLWERGYALDTVETALPWSAAIGAAREIQQSLRGAFAAHALRLLVFTHLSHIYADGASVYTTPRCVGRAASVVPYLPTLAGTVHVLRVRSGLICSQLWPPVMLHEEEIEFTGDPAHLVDTSFGLVLEE